MGTTQHQQQDEDEPLGGDILVGAEAILAYLIFLGLLPPDATAEQVYYLKRTGDFPIGNTGPGGTGNLLASRRRIGRHVQKRAAGG
jgi:hypothetical protein